VEEQKIKNKMKHWGVSDPL